MLALAVNVQDSSSSRVLPRGATSRTSGGPAALSLHSWVPLESVNNGRHRVSQRVQHMTVRELVTNSHLAWDCFAQPWHSQQAPFWFFFLL